MKIKYFIDEFEGMFTGENWVAISLKDIIDKITPENVYTKKLPNKHSIYELVAHSLAWRNFLLSRLNSDSALDIHQNDQNDWPQTVPSEWKNWENLKNQFINSQFDIIAALQHFDDQWLDQIVPKRTYNYKYLLNGIIQHDYYHFGQISLLL